MRGRRDTDQCDHREDFDQCEAEAGVVLLHIRRSDPYLPPFLLREASSRCIHHIGCFTLSVESYSRGLRTSCRWGLRMSCRFAEAPCPDLQTGLGENS